MEKLFIELMTKYTKMKKKITFEKKIKKNLYFSNIYGAEAKFGCSCDIF